MLYLFLVVLNFCRHDTCVQDRSRDVSRTICMQTSFPREVSRPSRGALGARIHAALGLDSTSRIGQHAAPFATQNQTPGICDHPLEVRGELNTHIRDRALCALTDGGIGGRGEGQIWRGGAAQLYGH